MEANLNLKQIKLNKFWSRVEYLIYAILLLVLVIFVIDWHFLKGEIASYEIAKCTFREDCEIPLNITVYTPKSNTQTVISRMPGIPGIETYNDCSVINRKNWECRFDDGSGDFGFIDGKYYQNSRDKFSQELDALERPVSKFRWYLSEFGIL